MNFERTVVAVAGVTLGASTAVLVGFWQMMPSQDLKRREELIKNAKELHGIDTTNFFNFGFAGQVKTGKSTLINALRGISNSATNNPDLAPVGITETTQNVNMYGFDDEYESHIRFYDIPGCGTQSHQSGQYYEDKGLCAFDYLFILVESTLREDDIAIATMAQKYEQPVAFIVSQMDTKLLNAVEMDEIYEEENQENADNLVEYVKNVFMNEIALKPELRNIPIFCVSSSRLLERVKAQLQNRTSRQQRPTFDEDKLLQAMIMVSNLRNSDDQDFMWYYKKDNYEYPMSYYDCFIVETAYLEHLKQQKSSIIAPRLALYDKFRYLVNSADDMRVLDGLYKPDNECNTLIPIYFKQKHIPIVRKRISMGLFAYIKNVDILYTIDAIKKLRARNEYSDLIFVIHGIGQKLEENIIETVEMVRTILNHEINLHKSKSASKRLINPLLLPIQWRSEMDLNEEQLDKISISKSKFIMNVKNLTSDVFNYMLGRQKEIMENLVKELNAAYSCFKKYNPNFKGKISILAHSLGSVIAYDILKERTKGVKFPVENFFAIGSPIGLWLHFRKTSIGQIFESTDNFKYFFNINYSDDPVSHHIEHLFEGTFQSLDPSFTTPNATKIILKKETYSGFAKSWRVDYELQTSKNILQGMNEWIPFYSEGKGILNHSAYWKSRELMNFIIEVLETSEDERVAVQKALNSQIINLIKKRENEIKQLGNDQNSFKNAVEKCCKEWKLDLGG